MKPLSFLPQTISGIATGADDDVGTALRPLPHQFLYLWPQRDVKEHSELLLLLLFLPGTTFVIVA